VELQHLFRSRYFTLVTGGGYFDIRGQLRSKVGIDLPPPPFGPGLIVDEARSRTDLDHINVYAYSYITPLKNLTVTLGLSADILEAESDAVGDHEEINPKFGVTWEPISGTTLRLAAFRMLKRTLITDQTLEPTQVAGLNQFFDDPNGTTGWRYGGAIDQKFTRDLFGGIEISRRDLAVPFLEGFADSPELTRAEEDWKEQLYRAYLFWTPHPWFALRAEYSFERYTTEGDTDQPKELLTHRIPVGAGFFHPSGFSATTTATYYHQRGRLMGPVGDFESGRDDFVLVDVGVHYRLPRRFGIVSIGVANLFDQDFRFFDRDVANPSIQPARTVFGRVTLAFP
jgi:hypothetical protein